MNERHAHKEGLLPPPMTSAMKLGDIAMRPIMAVLGGCKADSMQETHVWHPHRISPVLIDFKKAALVEPDEGASPRRGFFFHVPIISGMGWRAYSVVQAEEAPFYVGWSTADAATGDHIDTAVHRLVLSDSKVRMLNGPSNERTHFFGVNAAGAQIPVEIVGQGVLGSNEHKDIRLF